MRVSTNRRLDAAERLEVIDKLGEVAQLDQVQTGRRRVEIFVLENPGEMVRNKDGIDTRLERWVDIGARTIADHPGLRADKLMARDELCVGGGYLLAQDFDGTEMIAKPGTKQLVGLFHLVALGDDKQFVPLSELSEGFGNSWKQFHLLAGDGIYEAGDTLMLVRGD